MGRPFTTTIATALFAILPLAALAQLTPGTTLMGTIDQDLSSNHVVAGQPFTIHLKGVGWTQLDNTIAVDYDNSYVGYGCGFNSNGDVVLQLVASGTPGTHLIDMYPLLYTQQPSYSNTPYGMVPVLTYARDVPGLALGYELPAIRMAIQVVK